MCDSPLEGWAQASCPGGVHPLRPAHTSQCLPCAFPEPGRVQRATALSSTCSASIAGAAVLLANPCSSPHFHSQSPFFSSSLPPSVGFQQQQREGSGARQPVHRLLFQGRGCSMRQSPVSKVGRATGLPGLGSGEAEHTLTTHAT